MHGAMNATIFIRNIRKNMIPHFFLIIFEE